ncbi:MAG: DUF444 family protein [Alphaproteobacteria bacterium]|nr:DUF444 family protein [Alphaproteobacteria bacterium]
MPHFIDRRLNPKDKSLGNRQRFLKRVRSQVKEAVDKAIQGRNIADADKGETVTIPTKGIAQPTFRHSTSGGYRERVLPGNKEFQAGDKIEKPPAGGGGDGGKEGSDQGEDEDTFVFALSREEFLDLFFEDLELPDLIKNNLKEVISNKYRRAGYSMAGSPSNINVIQTMQRSLGRRLALRRPKEEGIQELQHEIFALEKISEPTIEQWARLKELHETLEELQRKRRVIAYIDPLDVRYNYFQPKPEPNTNAVMFCLMDTSASMGEREKDLAKRFFVLLHLFLKRRYDRIDVIFIRHTHESSEVDEETFFYATESGGTVVSTALVEMQEIVEKRYPPSEWNIYAAQASDGENFSGDSAKCNDLLQSVLMPICQYFAYIEILDEREADIFNDETQGAELWRSYRQVYDEWQNFAMKRISSPADIYPVFRELFAKKDERV